MKKFAVTESITPERMKEKRKELCLTQKEFAELLGVSKPTVERWESSGKPITGPVVLLLQLISPDFVSDITIPEKTLPLRLLYMHRDKLCTIIDVDDSKKKVEIKNFVRNKQFMAFGANFTPTYDDYQEFLRSRCFPETRDKMKLILKDLDLPFYDPFMIIEKTEGRMAEDDFRIKVEK